MDSDCNIYFCGEYSGDLSFENATLTATAPSPGDPTDGYVASFTRDGMFRWQDRLDQPCHAIAVAAPDDLMVAGVANDGIVIARFGDNAADQWTTRFGTATDNRVTALAAAGNNRVVVGGGFGSGAITFLPQPGDPSIPQTVGDQSAGFVASLDRAGGIQWLHLVNGPSDVGPTTNGGERVDDLVVHRDRIYMAATLGGPRDDCPGPTPTAHTDAFVVQYDLDGNFISPRTRPVRSCGDTDHPTNDDARAVAVADVAGGQMVCIGGDTQGLAPEALPPLTPPLQTVGGGSIEAFLACYEHHTLEAGWAILYGSVNADAATALASTADGELWSVGVSESGTIEIGEDSPLSFTVPPTPYFRATYAFRFAPDGRAVDVRDPGYPGPGSVAVSSVVAGEALIIGGWLPAQATPDMGESRPESAGMLLHFFPAP